MSDMHEEIEQGIGEMWQAQRIAKEQGITEEEALRQVWGVQNKLSEALEERLMVLGWPFVGPLTRDQAESEAAYLRYCEEQEREHELEQQHGGLTRCRRCNQFTVEHIPCHNGYDPTTLYRCTAEGCGWEDFAG